MNRVTRMVSLLALASTVSACAGLSSRVDRSALADVPNEELLVLFDAETDVYIARDEADLASRNLQDAKLGLEKARKYRALVASRRTSGATIDSVPVLEMLGTWNEARIAMREAEVALRDTELETSDTRLWAARARDELEKARLVKDKNPAVGKDLELKSFEEQEKAWQVREAEAKALVDEKNAAVVAARTRYYELSRQLQDASGGAYGGPWADLLD